MRDHDGGGDPITVPLRRYQDLLWAVEACVGDHGGTFLVDTGAGLTSLDSALVARLGRTTFGRITGHRMTGERIDLARCEDVEIELGGRRFRHETVGVTDIGGLLPPDWPSVAGAIGLNTFASQPVTLDFAGNRLVLETPESLGSRAAGGVPLRVRISRSATGHTLDVFVSARAEAGALWLELDSGNTGATILAPHAAGALGLPADVAGPVEIDLPDLGPTRMEVVVKDVIYDGVLGAAFLRGRTLTMDLAAGRLWIS